LGSELLADQEFSIIDQSFASKCPRLQDFLKNYKVEIAGESHIAYQWLAIHSGYGGGAEAEHFDWAVRGVNKGFSFVPANMHKPLRHQLCLGFMDFVADHTEFFSVLQGAD